MSARRYILGGWNILRTALRADALTESADAVTTASQAASELEKTASASGVDRCSTRPLGIWLTIDTKQLGSAPWRVSTRLIEVANASKALGMSGLMATSPSRSAFDATTLSTASSWRIISAGRLSASSMCITSTATRPTTDSRTSSCSVLLSTLVYTEKRFGYRVDPRAWSSRVSGAAKRTNNIDTGLTRAGSARTRAAWRLCTRAIANQARSNNMGMVT